MLGPAGSEDVVGADRDADELCPQRSFSGFVASSDAVMDTGAALWECLTSVAVWTAERCDPG